MKEKRNEYQFEEKKSRWRMKQKTDVQQNEGRTESRKRIKERTLMNYGKDGNLQGFFFNFFKQISVRIDDKDTCQPKKQTSFRFI